MTKRYWVMGMLMASLGGAQAAEDLSWAREGNPDQRRHLDAMEGQPAPELQVSGWVNTQPVTLADLKGKVVVLDFWATWCGPCIASIPKNNELQAKYQEKGVVVLGICHPRGVDKMEAVVKSNKLKYPTARDPAGATIKAYGANSYPDYFIIDRQGVLRVADCQNGRVAEVIEKLLAEK